MVEEQMAERRARILEAARQLISAGGFEGLTMRQLAEAARVSVPTVYNLIGNKYLLLEALVKEHLSAALSKMAAVPPHLSMFEYVEFTVDVGHDVLLENPSYTRALIRVFLSSEDAVAARREADEPSIALIRAALRAGQESGEVLAWIDPQLAASTLYAIYMSGLLLWASHEIEEEELRLTTKLGMGLLLLGLARGEARDRLEQALRERQLAYQRLVSELQKGG